MSSKKSITWVARVSGTSGDFGVYSDDENGPDVIGLGSVIAKEVLGVDELEAVADRLGGNVCELSHRSSPHA
jgi:hypothetical protein